MSSLFAQKLYPMIRVLRLTNIKIEVVEKFYFYPYISDKIMSKHLPVAESSFTRVITDDFRSILCQQGLNVESRDDAIRDNDDSLFVVERE